MTGVQWAGRAFQRLWDIRLELIVTAMLAVLTLLQSLPPLSFLYSVARHDVRSVSDMGGWIRGGDALLSGDLANAYADANNQVGPLVLAYSSLISGALGDSVVAWSALFLIVVWSYLLTVALLARPRGAAGSQRWLGLAAAAVLVVLGYAAEFYAYGRWWYLPTLLLVLYGAVMAHRGRPLLSGSALGLAVWFEPSAALAVAVAALAPRWATALKTVAVAALVAVLAYLPFVPTDGFALGRGSWGVKHGTWVSIVQWVAPGFDPYPTWSDRVVQALVAIAIAAGVIWLLRRAVPMPALAIIATAVPGLARLTTETFWWRYHWIVPFVFLLAGAIRLLYLKHPAVIPVALSLWLGVVMVALWAPVAAATALLLLASTAAPTWSRLASGRWRTLDG